MHYLQGRSGSWHLERLVYQGHTVCPLLVFVCFSINQCSQGCPDEVCQSSSTHPVVNTAGGAVHEERALPYLCLVPSLSSVYYKFIQPGSLRGRGGLPWPGPAYPRGSFLVNSSVGCQADERSRLRVRMECRGESTDFGKGRWRLSDR